jgi:RsiW-degrading membrane proteinase PrsW (M82 family)
METALYITKLALAMTGVWMIYSSSKKESKPWQLYTGCSLFGLVLFMTGVEFISPVDNAWTYLLFEAGQDDFIKALSGGSMMLALPIILMVVCGKDIAGIMEAFRGESPVTSKESPTEE